VKYDALLNILDTHLMFGVTVAGLSSDAALLYVPAEYIYYSIGGVIGAAILFLCFAGDRRAAFQMSGAILTAYFISLGVFYIFPAQGPFIAAGLPPHLFTAAIQRASLINATVLYHHAGWITPPRAYYVAFPSMHVAQPLIAAWFLRRWRAVSAIIFVYCALLTASIVILQWHYVVDILGGIGVAALAVYVVTAGAGRFSVPADHLDKPVSNTVLDCGLAIIDK
jgi:membrane-associated phospholipid phosphatase